jgi:succinate dehydrogenase / fumarate reductase cytochrome b subunit
MSEAVKNASKERPQIRNIHITDLMRYRLPVPGIVSILHRISGAVLFLALPFLLYLFELSIRSEYSYAEMGGVIEHPVTKLVLVVLAWGYLQHFFAGIRHLVMDTHIGLDKQSARKSAGTVLVLTAITTLLVALKLFGVF